MLKPEEIDCNKCVNGGNVRGLSQESYCERCIYGQKWKKDYYIEVDHTNIEGE